MPTADEAPHDFPDQAIREQLQNPANLRELLNEVLGEIADGFVCEEREILPRELPLEDWRHRESDLLFRIPYKTPTETVPVFVCVLLEHQRVLRRLEGLADRDQVRWHELVRFSLLWALYRRSRAEREPLIAVAQASQTNVVRQKEVQAVGMTIAEALKAEGRAEGKAEGKAEGRLDEAREILQALLEEKFRVLPEAVRQRIQASTDLARLNAAARRVLHLGSLEDFEL